MMMMMMMMMNITAAGAVDRELLYIELGDLSPLKATTAATATTENNKQQQQLCTPSWSQSCAPDFGVKTLHLILESTLCIPFWSQNCAPNVGVETVPHFEVKTTRTYAQTLHSRAHPQDYVRRPNSLK